MTTKTSETTKTSTPPGEEARDGPLMDGMSATVKKMVQKAKERGYVTIDELNKVLPQEQLSSEQIEDTMVMLSERGISVIEGEEPEEAPPAGEEERASVNGNPSRRKRSWNSSNENGSPRSNCRFR